jgi:pimeloyl-ACP methyl ester carboxylesterase
MPHFPDARRVELPGRDGMTLSVHEQGEGPAVVFCHGFPELAYSWRYQLPAVADAGFRAIAPDQRGYGGSDRPEKIEDYDLLNLTGDLAALLDALEVEDAVFVGHDWGGWVAWGMALVYPDRTAGVAGVCTPYVAMPATEVMRTTTGVPDENIYILWFQQPGVAEAVLDKQARRLFEVMMREPISPEAAAARMLQSGQLDMNPFRRLEELEPEGKLIVSAEELDYYVEAFEKSGFRGGINWYRNIDRNLQLVPDMGARKLALPCLMVTAGWDAALRPEMAAGMPEVCADLEMQEVPRAGHWIQQEKPGELNAHLCSWLKRRFSPAAGES